MDCLLCGSKNTQIYREFEEKTYGKLRRWKYFTCQNCDLIFRDPTQRPKPEEEQSRYKEHQNLWNKTYEKYLNELWQPLSSYIPKEAKKGLDFGCGATEGLKELLKDSSYSIESYDFYFKDDVLKNSEYDFVYCSEVVEHFYNVKRNFDILIDTLKAGALLAVSTQKPPADPEDFQTWYYRKDPTHVAFYNSKTWDWIAESMGFEVLYQENPIVILKKEKLK